MNTEVIEQTTETADPDVLQYEATLKARYDKHQKASRNFPKLNEIAVGDRFTVPKGASVMSNVLGQPIILQFDIKVEVSEVFDGEISEYEKEFRVVKFDYDISNGLKMDEAFGSATVCYTDLKDWYYKSK